MKLNTHNYKGILTALSLPEFWESQLRSNDAKTNGTALRMLDGIKENVSGGVISHRVHTQNNGIRKFAKSIYVEFASNDAFKFLEDDFDKDFNALDEIRIHSSLKQKQKEKPLPLLIRWVNMAQNSKYKAFLIKEIGLFNQTESAPHLLELYRETEDYPVKAQIAQTLGMLGYTEAVPVLIEDFDYNPQTVQDNSIDALGQLGGEQALQFLENTYHQTHNKETLVKVLRNIRLTDQQGRVYAKLKNSATTDFEKDAIAYVEQDTSDLAKQQIKVDA